MVYLISGLGADERLFRYLDLGNTAHRFINWITPLRKESIRNYARRLLDQIDLKREVILVGVSFGGMMAQEIAQLIPCRKVILISSVKSEKEFDFRFNLMAQSRVISFLPPRLLKRSASLLANYFFSIKTPEEAAFLAELIEPADPYLIKWSVQKVLEWKRPGQTKNLVHIHGNEDRIFPIRKIRNAEIVAGGGHFMVVTQANLISDLLKKEIFNASGQAGAPDGQ